MCEIPTTENGKTASFSNSKNHWNQFAEWLEQICGHCSETVPILHHNVMVMFCGTDGTVASVFIEHTRPQSKAQRYTSSDFLTLMFCFWCFWNLLIVVQQTEIHQQWIHGPNHCRPQIEFPHKTPPSSPKRHSVSIAAAARSTRQETTPPISSEVKQPQAQPLCGIDDPK